MQIDSLCHGEDCIILSLDPLHSHTAVYEDKARKRERGGVELRTMAAFLHAHILEDCESESTAIALEHKTKNWKQ